MKREVPVFVNEMSLKEYLMIFKMFMKNTGCEHVSGFVNISVLCENPTQEEFEKLFKNGIKRGILMRDGETTTINPMLYTFINAWIHSRDVVVLKKDSYGEQKALFIARVEEMVLSVFQDSSKNKAVLVADPNVESIYAYFKNEIEKKDKNKAFRLKNTNKIFKETHRAFQLEVDPINRIVLQCVESASGKKHELDRLIHIGKKSLEVITLNDEQTISNVDKFDVDKLEKIVIDYVTDNCRINTEEFASQKTKAKDPEDYTRHSFMKLTADTEFPKGFFTFAKKIIVSYVKSFTGWKNFLKRAGIMLGMGCTAYLWNMFVLCFLNDTFNISKRALLGNSTAYLLAGIADARSIIGMPKFVGTVDTVILTAFLYFLLPISIGTIIRDISNGEIRNNMLRFGSFGKKIREYQSSAYKKISYYIWSGLAAAMALNLLIFNPYTVLLLAFMLLFSCMKGDDGSVSSFFMAIRSSIKYKKVMNGQCKMPMFGDVQLKIFGISIGLLVASLLNIVLWFLLNFNFWVRLAISIVIIIFAMIKLGMIKLSKPAEMILFVAVFFIIQMAAVSVGEPLNVFADDGGWTESGRTLRGFVNNSGFLQISNYSLIIGAAVAAGVFLDDILKHILKNKNSFKEKGQELWDDFILGRYSTYGGDSIGAAAVGVGVSFIPIVGDIYGVVSGIRDCTYDIQNKDWAALGIDGLCLVLSALGLKGAAVKSGISMAKATGSMSADVIQNAVKNNADTIGRQIDDFNSVKVNKAVSQEFFETGKKLGYSEDTLRNYYDKLEREVLDILGKEKWKEGYENLSLPEKHIIDNMLRDEGATYAAFANTKRKSMEVLEELSERYQKGKFDSDNFTLDEVLQMKLSKTADAKSYEGIKYGNFLPRVDEFVSDKAVVDYVKELCPNDKGIAKCKNLQDLANELYKNPVELDLVTFQNANINGANFLNFNGDLGNMAHRLKDGGGTFAMPKAKLETLANKHQDIFSYKNGNLEIHDIKQFGEKVLSGVPLNQADGVYMINTKVPLNGTNVSMPSVNNSSAYLNQFVSGGNLMSGGTEVTFRPMKDIISNVSSEGSSLIGKNGDIEYIIKDMRRESVRGK